MNRGGRKRIARRVMAVAMMLGLGAVVVGGGVAFASDTASSGTPATTAPGVVSDYRVDTPALDPVPLGPGALIDQSGGGLAVTPDEVEWS